MQIGAVLDDGGALAVLRFGVTQHEHGLERHQGQHGGRPDLSLGEPDADARSLVQRLPDDVAAVLVGPAEAAVAAWSNADALGPEASPGRHGAIGIVEDPVVMLGPARKDLSWTA